MNAAVYTEDLQSLQAILQDWLEGMPLDFHCTSQEGALMILGQHSAELRLEASDLLRRLERRIQSLQLRFVQQARLYLRVTGESRPYAQRFFLIQPPPPPLPAATSSKATFQPSTFAETTTQQLSEEEFWVVSDEELDDLVNELVGDLQAMSFQPLPVTEQTKPPEPLALVTEEWDAEGDVVALNLVEPANTLPDALIADSPAAALLDASASDSPALDFSVCATDSLMSNPSVLSPAAESPLLVVDPLVTHAPLTEPVVTDGSAFHPFQTDAPIADTEIADPFALVPAETEEEKVASSQALSLIPWDGEPDALADPSLTPEMTGTLLPPLVAPPHPEGGETEKVGGISRRVWMGGAIALGFVSGVYGVSRPCVVGSCPELQTAQDLEQAAVQQAEAARDVEGLAEAQASLQQAIATLETIPGWSSRVGRAREQQKTYETHAMTLGTLTEAARVAKTARDRSQDAPLSVENWDNIITPLKTVINRLDGVSPANPFYAAAQQQQQLYEAQLTRYMRQQAMEQEAQEVLNMARQGIEMAEARQQLAQSKEQWQMVRITWQVVVNRLNEVPAGTYAAIEAGRLLQNYEPRLEAAIAQMQQEATASERLIQATQYAQQAEVSANQFNWQGAIAAWTNAIREAEQIPPGSTHASAGEDLARRYQNAIDDAQKNLDNHLAVSLEIDRACNGEFRKCRLLVVSDEIRVQLSADYMDAIAAARNSGNRELQAVVTEHQLELRRTLQGLAARFQLPIEVYDNGNTLLDRHLPNASTT